MNPSIPNKHEYHLGEDLPQPTRIRCHATSCNGFPGPARAPETGRALLRQAVELGINLIDTAEFCQSSYGAVRANHLIHEALHPNPSDLMIAAKVCVVFTPKGTHRPATGADMRKLVEENLTSLGLHMRHP